MNSSRKKKKADNILALDEVSGIVLGDTGERGG